MDTCEEPNRLIAKLTVVTASLALLATGCGGGSSESSRTTMGRNEKTTTTTTTTATTAKPKGATTTTTAVPAPVIGEPFYEDAFTDATKGWPSGTATGVTYTLNSDGAQPELDILLAAAGTAVSPHPEFRDITSAQLHDYAVTAQLQTTLHISQKDSFGVTCRDLKGQRYMFVLNMPVSRTEPNQWAIIKRTADGSKALAKGTKKIGGSAFSITGVCRGGTDGPAQLDMAVNGERLGSASDDDKPLTEGYGGVYLNTAQGNSYLNILHFQASAAS